MFKTKLEVDRHVDNCLKKINNDTERNLRCFSFAKLYFNVGDYEHACRYVTSYLSVKPKSAEGQQLLGKCFEKLGKKEAALESYRNSLQIDPKQNNLVIKVCELLSSDDIDIDRTGAKYYCSLAQSFDPNHPAISSLKERLITTEHEDPVEVSKLLLKELETRPKDTNLRVRILKHFLQHNMIKEAYKHASAIEEKSLLIFHNNLSWYEIFAEVLMRFERDHSLSLLLTWEFWFLSISVLDRLVALSLDEHSENIKSSTEYITAVFNYDQVLSKASQNISSCPDRQLVSVFLSHYHAQLYFHIATLIFKQAKKDLINLKEASNITLPVLFAAYHTPLPDLQSLWLIHSPENIRRLVLHWHKDASYRCSQTGHILLAAAKDRKSIVLEKASQYSTGIWREQLYKTVFVKRDQHLKMSTSFFVSNSTPLDPVIKLPDPGDILKYDEVAQMIYPDSLHHYIWIALNNKLSDFDLKTFDGLQYSIRNLGNCAAESLNVLDIQAFVYCATLCAKSRLEENKNVIYYNNDKPRVLPASITENLATLNQAKFLSAAYNMYKNEPSADMGELRLLLVKGIEVIRCVGHHSLDVRLLVDLANIFSERAQNAKKLSEIEFNSSRADLYWKNALPLLEKMKNNKVITYSNGRLFEFRSKEMSISEINTNIENGKLFTATQLMKKKEYEKALLIFEHLKDPYASFYQSQIYKHMADEKTNQNKENVTSEMRSQNIILLSKARDCLYLTLDRLREPSVDRSHQLNAQLGTEIEKIERLLSHIDPDCTDRNECDGMSDENASSDNSAGDHYLSNYTHTTGFQNVTNLTPKIDTQNNHSTPLRFSITRQEARPSPERLDAQIRQIMASRDTALTSILDQNRIMVDSHKSLLEELRSFKDAVNNLTAMVEDLKTMKGGFEELKDVKKSVDELKHSVDDLQNVVDVVKDMRKELNDLKKDQNKNNQLSDEDLYVLDSDYGVDYNINSNLNAYGTNIPNVFPNYPAGRIPNATALAAYGPPGLYPGLYPGLAYAYGGLGLPQPGTLPFASDPSVPGLTSVPTSYPQTMMGQPALNPGLPPNSLGIGLLAGQALSQVAPASQYQREVSKASTANVTSMTQSISHSAASTSVSRALPVNVVITNSDPLPTNKTVTSQPVLSVTIPPQHIKGGTTKSQPHNYQIPLPSSGITTVASTPSILSKPPPAISTQSLLSNIAAPIFSAVSQNKSTSKNISLGLQIEKTLEDTFNSTKNNTSNLSNLSTTSIEEHDPCPDFKPIIPLPDEVPINTGEENEEELFCERAKLFRFVTCNGANEWKERGVGVLKVLSNPNTGKVRILMRRDQVHKICANHFITKDMTLTPMKDNDRVYIWAAHDFADEVMVIEKFCVRFKTSEETRKFHDAFEAAQAVLSEKQQTSSLEVKTDRQENFKLKPSKNIGTPKSINQTTLGGFVFTSTPTFKPTEKETASKVIEKQEVYKSSPFSSFTFGKTSSINNSMKNSTPTAEPQTFSPLVISQQKMNNSQNEDDSSHAENFVPTAEFKPVIALPDLVEVKTGEENSEVLFEGRAKLFRYDTSEETKQWKERGVGVIKILKDETIRLLMRRDQVHKVCCNHQVLKNMSFKLNISNPKAIVWSCQDFSEGALIPETFTVRFKTEDQACQFLQTLQTAQTSLDENNKVTNKHHKPEARTRSTSFSDKFKPAKGTWECKNCYVFNEGKTSHCVACETPKSGTTAKPTEASGSLFSFGITANKVQPAKPTSSFVFGQKTTWGDTFKPAEGSWECMTCYIRNTQDTEKCVSCQTNKDGSIPPAPETKPATEGIDLSTPGQTFLFGMPKPVVDSISDATLNFGSTFVPKVGLWKCSNCLTLNESNTQSCGSCQSSEVTEQKGSYQESKKNQATTTKFTFGIPPKSAAAELTSTSSISAIDVTKTITNTKHTSFFKPPTSPLLSFNSKTKPADSKFIFGSPQKHDFEFKPRLSPRRVSSGQGDDGESDGSYAEDDEDNIYFKPVIPLPDIVEVKTGEEEEDVLYCHRAKLFRFVSGEWKERGIGDVKILRNKSTGKLRVVMRREQVLKICLNHSLSSNVEYIQKDEKSWLFHVADYSEGEISHEQFCLRFKSDDIAQKFKKAVDNALDVGTAGGDQGHISISTKEDSDGEVEIVSETEVTPDEEKEALRLGLPPKFLSYKQLPDCTCEQCIKDDEYLKDLFTIGKSQSSETPFKKSAPIIFGTPSSNLATPSTGNSIFGTPTGSLFNFTPQSQSKSETLRSLLLKPSNLTSPHAITTPTTELIKTEENLIKQFSFVGATTQTPYSGNISAQTSATGDNIFSGSNNGLFSSSGKSSFSNDSETPTPTSGLFHNPTSSVTTCSDSLTTSIFSSSSTSIPKNIFSMNNSSKTSIFSSIPSSTTSLFGSTAATPIFGNSKNASIFGGTPTTTSASVFGSTTKHVSPSNTNILNPAASSSDDETVGQAPRDVIPDTQSIDMTVTEKTNANDLKEGYNIIFKSGSNISFADLAANTADTKPAFSKTGDESFTFLGAGAPVFGSMMKSSKKNQDVDKSKLESDDENAANTQGNEEYDPHYEPIVPLPDAIIVSTGEEDETALFNERAKLYRFDANTKEWKERGVGQMKLLHHAENNTYRLLLRRELVHKLVLNQRIVPSLELQPMMSSDKAWMWAGYNYTDDENNLEKLAVRFKNIELAQKFYTVVTEVVNKVIEIQNNKSLPATVQNYGVEDLSSGDEQHIDGDPNNEDCEDDGEDDYDEDDRSVMFMKRCTLSQLEPNNTWKKVCMGDLQVYYDAELYAARIGVNDDGGNAASNTLIGINTLMDIDKNECTWKAVEWAEGEGQWRTLKATFSSEIAAQEFHSNYLEGINYAQQVGIVDEISQLYDTEETED